MPSFLNPELRRRARGRRCGTAFLASLLPLLLVAEAAAQDQRPTFRTPGYRGMTKAPATEPAAAPSPALLGRGQRPDMVVDDAGSAHLVWNEPGGEAPDVTRYCRLPRSGAACERTQAIVPDQPAGPGFGPEFNDDVSGPRVLVLGDDVAVLTFRFPNPIAKPGRGVSSSSLYLALSDDGGESFSAPTLVGDLETSGDAISFPVGDTDAVAVVSDTKTGGTFLQVVRPGTFPAAPSLLGEGEQAFGGTLAVDGQGRPVAAFNDSSPAVFVRRWTGTGDPQDPATWTQEPAFAGAEPTLASGPAGVFVLHRTDLLGPYDLRALSADGRAGPPIRVSTTPDETEGDLVQDAGGRLFASWVDPISDGNGARLLVRRSAGGGPPDPPILLGAGPAGAIGDVALGAAFDGGGFGTWVQRAPGEAVGDVLAAGFGPLTRTGRAGLGALAGGGREPGTVLECQAARFGAVRLSVAEGCLLAARDGSGSRVSEGAIRLNGLDIVPDAGVKIIVNARRRTLDTTGDVRVLLRGAGVGEIELWHGDLHVRLPTAGVGTELFDFDTNRFASVLKGFPIKGRIKVELREQSVRIPVSLALPRVFGDIRGEAVLEADNANGLRLESMAIRVANAFIGPVELQKLALTYARQGEVWEGTVGVGLPPRPTGPALAAEVRFEAGAFARAGMTLTFPFPGVKLGPGVFLTQIGAKLFLEPLLIEGSLRVGALPVGGGTSTVDIDAAVRATFPTGAPARFELDGRASLVGIGVSSMKALAQTDGYLQMSGGYDLDLELVKLKGALGVVVDGPAETFSGDIDSETCLDLIIDVCARSQAVISSRGLGACLGAKATGPDGQRPTAEQLLKIRSEQGEEAFQQATAAFGEGGSVGFAYPWNGSIPGDVDIMLGDCDLSGYKIPPRGGGRAAQAGAGFTIARGTESASLRVPGDGGAPSVVLVSPSGARIVPADRPGPGTPAWALAASEQATTYVALTAPEAGAWSVEAAPGSPALGALELATGRGPLEVEASVGRRDRRGRFTLTYAAERRPDLAVRFRERGPGGGGDLGPASAARGTLRFTPSPGAPGRREIIAVTEREGVAVRERVVAAYTVPRPQRPGAVPGLRADRRAGALLIRWQPATRAARYAVRVQTADGRRLLRIATARRRVVRVPRVARADRFAVSVTALTPDGLAGPARRARG